LPTSCLSPCHGFNGIVEQWKTSTHYSTFISNLGGEEVDTWTGPGPCGNCHAHDAIEQRVANRLGTAAGGVVANPSHGELGYKHPTTGALTEATYTGTSKVAQVGCVTCHSVTDTTDPHRTGLPYAAGSFPLRVPSGANDVARIEKSPDETAVTGTPVSVGSANTCVWCHRSRKDVTNYIGATVTLTSVNWGPHEGPQADIHSAAGGYHFAGRAYGTSTHQQALNCIDCHMPKVTGNSNSANHSFYPQLSACTSCHIGATSFDVNGGRSQTQAGIFELQKALNDAGLLTRSTAAPYQPLTAAQLGDGFFELDKTKPAVATDAGTPRLTRDQAGALYNYLIVARDHSLGAHNPKYTRQLIFDSYFAMTGVPPTTIIRPQ
jgi:formate-dependent nitrite reductase cytochrome c552 subunit